MTLQDLSDLSNKLAKHDNDSAQNASMRSTKETDATLLMTIDGEKDTRQRGIATQPNAFGINEAKLNVANGQISTTVKLEPKVDGGRRIKVAPPVVTLTGNDEM